MRVPARMEPDMWSPKEPCDDRILDLLFTCQ